MTDQPLEKMCPKCGEMVEMVPHETHLQRWEDCFSMFMKEKYFEIPVEVRCKMAMNFFNELNDFIISDNISRDKMRTTQYIASKKKENIKEMQKK